MTSWSNILLLFCSALFWSFSGIFTKSVLWNGWSLACVRGSLMFVIVLIVRGRRPVCLNKTTLLMALCYFLQGVLFLSANKLTAAGNATVLANTSPLFIILCSAVFLHQKPHAADIAVCCALLIGIALTFLGNMAAGSVRGNLCAVVSGVFYAGVFFLSGQKGANAMDALLLGNALYLPFLIPLFMQDTVRQTGPAQWAFILVFSLITGAAAWLCFAKGIKGTPPLHANFITMLEPIMAPMWTFFFLSEKLPPLSFAGFGIVLAALVLHQLWLHRRAKQRVSST